MISIQMMAIVLIGAAVLDYGIGDPGLWPHPVQAMGWTIDYYTKSILGRLKVSWQLRIAGIVLTLGLGIGSGIIAWLLLLWALQLSLYFNLGLQIIILASCFAGRSLRWAAEDVLGPLEKGELEQARSHLSFYVGRETENLSQAEIRRAVLETVSENSVDGVMAPLFFALLGSVVPGVGPVPLAIAYKAVSTLDSMVGYRTPPYTDLGWCSAKTDDVLTWLPCRLMVLTLGLVLKQPCFLWRICQRDGPKDPSPNSGWSECAYAVSLGVQLGGSNTYQGVVKEKPLLGEPLREISTDIIRQGLQLTRTCFILWISIFLGIRAVIHYGGCYSNPIGG